MLKVSWCSPPVDVDNYVRHLTPRLLIPSLPPPRHLQSHIHPAPVGLDTGTTSNELEDAAAKLAAQGTSLDSSPQNHNSQLSPLFYFPRTYENTALLL